MKIIHWLKKENSGLFRTTIELAKYEERAGHIVSLRLPKENRSYYGFGDDDCDIHCVHSQFHPHYYKDDKPKLLFLHGEPEYGLMNKVSTSAIMDLVPLMDAFICFNEAEAKIWNSFKRTYVIPKGVDLETYKPLTLKKKLKGSPAILYAEHWRSFRHPLHVFIALERVVKKLPQMRFYPVGCPEKEKPFWDRIIRQNRYKLFTPALIGNFNKMQIILNMADIVVSPVYPSYGRVSLEAMACGKPVVAYKTNPYATYKCEPYKPDDMAEKIDRCYENFYCNRDYQQRLNSIREHCKQFDAKIMAEKAIEIYRRFV